MTNLILNGNLTTFLPDAAAARVMRPEGRISYDVGAAADYFGADLPLIQVGESQGEDEQRGAYDWWPLTIDGQVIGELRDDASGMTVHVIN